MVFELKHKNVTDLLMGENVATDLTLLTLDDLHVCFHALRRKGSREQIVDVCVRMKTSKLTQNSTVQSEHESPMVKKKAN